MNTKNLSIFTIVLIILLVSFTSANSYLDSSYIDNKAKTISSTFYTPDNAYRTYCSSGFCPESTYVTELNFKPMPQPQKIIYIRGYVQSKPFYYPYHEPKMVLKSQPIRIMPRPLYYR